MAHSASALKTLLCASALLGAALASGRAAQAADHPNMQPGSWELTISTEIPGMPPTPAMTMTQCYKADQVKDSQSFADRMQQQRRGKGKCKVSEIKFESDKLSYGFACEDGTNGTTEMIFGGASYEGTIRMTVASRHGNGPMAITQHLKGKRVGDC